MSARVPRLDVVQGGRDVRRHTPVTNSRAQDLSTLRRGMEILQVLQHSEWADDDRGWGNNRIAEHLGVDKSQVSRTLRVLEEAGWVERDEQTRTYRLGSAMYSLGMRAADQSLMRDGAAVVRRAAAATGCRVFLVVRRGLDVVTVWSDQPPGQTPVVHSIGMTYPVESTETGRALLFSTPPERIRELLAERCTVEGLTDLIDQVARDRATGYSYGTVPGAANGSVAVPIWNVGRQVTAAIGAAGAPVADRSEMIRVARVLLAAAAEVTRQQTAAHRARVAVHSVPYEGWPSAPSLSRAQ